jgi:phosphoadenosine phosphosulfate reductase
VRGLDATVERPPDLEGSSAEEVLEYVVERFHPRLYVACSFQKEASVIMDMLLRIEPTTRFFTLDTDLLFEETYATWRALEERFGIEIDVFRGLTLEEQAAEHGDALWARDPDKCCGIRKVTPLKRALSDVDCWVAGLRREQSKSRREAKKIDWDLRHGLWKANPLADWSERDVWAYIARHELPYNQLHDRGYPSIGCTHCTLPAAAGRDGRWADAEKTECGLH